MNDFEIVEMLHATGAFTAHENRDRALEIFNAVVRVFRAQQVNSGEAMVVFHSLIRQLAVLSTELTGETTHAGHVIAALGMMNGYTYAAISGMAEAAPKVPPPKRPSEPNARLN